jgi:nicotinamide mononucleotide transporter
VILAAKGNIWCWPAALLSTVIYTVIFYEVYLWMDSALQVYYMVMAFYGWFCWRKGNQTNNDFNDTITHRIKIKKWQFQAHIKAIILLIVLSFIVGKLMATYTPTHFPYFDAATTVFAVFATYLVTQKVLENWIYWIVIDFVSIYLYVQKELTPTAVLFILYVGLATYGYFQWRKEYKSQHANPPNLTHT